MDPFTALAFAIAPDQSLLQSLETIDSARARHERGLEHEISRLRRTLQARISCHRLLSNHPAIQALFEVIDVLGSTGLPVLIEGEAGSGKQQLARAIHEASSHGARGAFVLVNGSVPPVPALPRAIEQAQRGTLFVREIALMPFSVQAELFLWLRNSQGGGTRLIVSSRKSLGRLARHGTVLEELWHCLRPVRLQMPPLRQRREDIRLLAEHFAGLHAPVSKVMPIITPAAMRRLFQHRWPGNIRELETVIQGACLVMRGNRIDEDDLPPSLTGRPEPITYRVTLDRPLRQLLRETLATIERQYLRKALRRVHGNVRLAARLCRLSRRSVTAKIAAYGIDRLAFRQA